MVLTCRSMWFVLKLVREIDEMNSQETHECPARFPQDHPLEVGICCGSNNLKSTFCADDICSLVSWWSMILLMNQNVHGDDNSWYWCDHDMNFGWMWIHLHHRFSMIHNQPLWKSGFWRMNGYSLIMIDFRWFYNLQFIFLLTFHSRCSMIIYHGTFSSKPCWITGG